MLSLSNEAITAWATSSGEDDGRVPDAATSNLTGDGLVAAALERLASLLGPGGEEDAPAIIRRLSDPTAIEEMRRVLAQAGARTSLRVLAWLADELPGGAEIATNLVDQRAVDGIGVLLAECDRSALLRRLYDPERLRTLERACRAAQAMSEAA